MDYLPIFMKLQDREAVVIGGGVIASRKAALIAKSGPRLTIISPEISDAMRVPVENGDYVWIEREFVPADLDSAHIVIAATDDAAVNRNVHSAAMRRLIPVNVVDTPELCSFILPAIVDRSPVVVAISTGGRSPVLARFVKSQLERMLPSRLGRLADICGRLRNRVKRRVKNALERRRFWEHLFESNFPDFVYAGRDEDALRHVEINLSREPSGNARSSGAVYLIGAGPGDPELLTLKAQRLLQRADVVLYDRLVPVGVLEMCRREAELIYVGKRNGDHPVSQDKIGSLLVEHAEMGRRVARLKGGDPFIFGRGGEELQVLTESGVDFQVVPGVSAANGSASYAGIPLTHRDHAQSVSFWTGHSRDGGLDLDWSSMCQSRQTLVFYMGSSNAALISKQLIGHGMAVTTPVAVVQAATTPRQKVLCTSIYKLRDVGEVLDRSLPTLIIVGSVVKLRTDLDWFGGDPDSSAAVFPRHLRSDQASSENGAA